MCPPTPAAAAFCAACRLLFLTRTLYFMIFRLLSGTSGNCRVTGMPPCGGGAWPLFGLALAASLTPRAFTAATTGGGATSTLAALCWLANIAVNCWYRADVG